MAVPAQRAAGVSKFLLTRPSRGATYDDQKVYLDFNISTHTPLAGRDQHNITVELYENISTHTPLAGRDIRVRMMSNCSFVFLLTRPSRGATNLHTYSFGNTEISTHTPLAGRDF